MAGYLKRYVKKWRVKADYDLSTNDFPRDKDENLEPSFDDYYIPCDSDCKIRHFQRDILFYYCPSIGRFRNILKQIYTDKIGSLDKFKKIKTSEKDGKVTEKEIFNTEEMYQGLLNKNILTYIEELDYEGEFRFKADQIDYIAETVGAKTFGANISPLSPKNLPSIKYDIPYEELTSYKEITKDLETKELYIISKLNSNFDDIIKEKKCTQFDVNKERKKSCLGTKEFIHSIGMFKEYLLYLKENIATLRK